MKRYRLPFAVAAGLLCAQVLTAQEPRNLAVVDRASERRLALVVGNNAYPEMPLQNAVSDAKAIDQALRDSGFEVDVVLDATLKDLDRAIDRFASKLHQGDVALFYYSGHGIQVANENYLVPVDFKAREEADAKYEAVPASRVVDRLSDSGARLSIVVLDACRNNPFRSSRSGTRGLAPMESGRGSLIAFATAPNRTADDNPRGANGLFTSYVLEAMELPGLNIEQVFSRARQSVYQESKGAQVPWVVSSVIGDFYFRGPSSTGPVNPPNPPRPRPPSDPKAAIGDVLTRYRQAYQAMDVDAVLRVYPGFPGRQDLQKRFADLQAVAMALGTPAIELTSDTTATAAVLYSLTFTSKTGKIENTKPQRAEFTFKRTSGEWVIDSVRFLRMSAR